MSAALFLSSRGLAAAATAATAAIIAAGVVAVTINQQKDDDNEQKPAAINAAKQVSQTHTVRRLLSLLSFHTMTIVQKV